MSLSTVALVVFGIFRSTVADYKCVCNYDVKANVFRTMGSVNNAVTFMKEFECQPLVKQHTNNWAEVSLPTMPHAFVKTGLDVLIQNCPGDPPTSPKDTTSTQTTTTTRSTTTRRPPTTTPQNPLYCYRCSNITNSLNCRTTTKCAVGQKCYIYMSNDVNNPTINLGCKAEHECPINGGPYIVGRSMPEGPLCHSCCDRDMCNRQLCPMFQTDVEWGLWSQWSSCSVTCGSGKTVRERTCTEIGNCDGSDRETKECYMTKCMNNTWSYWSPWSSCSSTCGIGLRTRTRSCLDNRDCAGHSTETDFCRLNRCADNTWSDWSIWSPCTASCDTGLKTRTRYCTQFGGICTGHSVETDLCGRTSCIGSSSDPLPTTTASIQYSTLLSSTNATGSFIHSNPWTALQYSTGTSAVSLQTSIETSYSPSIPTKPSTLGSTSYLHYCKDGPPILPHTYPTNVTADTVTLKCLDGYEFVTANASVTILCDATSRTWRRPFPICEPKGTSNFPLSTKIASTWFSTSPSSTNATMSIYTFVQPIPWTSFKYTTGSSTLSSQTSTFSSPTLSLLMKPSTHGTFQRLSSLTFSSQTSATSGSSTPSTSTKPSTLGSTPTLSYCRDGAPKVPNAYPTHVAADSVTIKCLSGYAFAKGNVFERIICDDTNQAWKRPFPTCEPKERCETSHDCLNTGACFPGDHRCQCAVGYFGTNCDTEILVGTLVVRGPDWPGSDQDGNGVGVIVRLVGARVNQIYVRWKTTGIEDTYRVGEFGKYDVRPYKPGPLI